MNLFDQIQSFIEQCGQAQNVETLSRQFQATLEQLGFRYFACGIHGDPLHARDAVMILNYPRAWVKSYSEMRLHCLDPVFARADRQALPFFWDDAAFQAGMRPQQRSMFEEARRFGVAHGYTIPIHSPRVPVPRRASCSVIPESSTGPMQNYLAIQLMAGYLFERAACLTDSDPPPLPSDSPMLTARQRQCLELAGVGNTDRDIAAILRISRHTVHAHIATAMWLLKAASRQEAVLAALASGQISYGDLIRSASPPAWLDPVGPARSTRQAPRAGENEGSAPLSS